MRSDDERQGIIIYSTQQELSLPDLSQTLLVTDERSVPLAIFSTELSTLQALVRYLHDVRLLPFSEIAALLSRSEKTIWATYDKVKDAPFSWKEGGFTIPVSSFSNRLYAPLEALVLYLKRIGLRNVEIARVLKLDPRTTWTVARRTGKKQEVAP